MLTSPPPDWMVIDAVRYAIGRTSYQVSVTCEWLRDNWLRIPENVRDIIRRNVEDAFRLVDGLGHDCDRAEWESVRSLWSTPNTAARGKE